MKPTVYLSGTLTGRNRKEVAAERARARRVLEKNGFIVFDPTSIEENHLGCKFKSNHSLQVMASYIRHEKQVIRHCDAMLVLTGDRPSDGTWYEMAFAKYQCGIPVVLVAPRRAKGKLVSWSNLEASAIASSIGGAVVELQELLGVESPE